jgi:hypothetical protein
MAATFDNPQSTVTTQITEETSIFIATTVRLHGNKNLKILYFQVIKKY